MTGELQFAGVLRLDGNFHGSIQSSDILIVGEHAMVHADIKAGEIEVHGKVFGTLEAKRRIEIHPTGRVAGDIQTPVLVVNPGRAFDGKSRMAGDKNKDDGVETTENTELIEEGANEAD